MNSLRALADLRSSMDARFHRWRNGAHVLSTVARAAGPSAALRALLGRTHGALIQVENTNYCNFRCAYCPTHSEGSIHPVRRGHMTMSTFEQILTDQPRAVVVVLQGQGEPMLDPTIFEKLALARRRGLITQIITNGSLLQHEGTASRLLLEGPDILLVSLDAVSPERNVVQRKGLRYEQVFNSLTALCAARRETRRRMIVGLLSIVHGQFDAETEAALRAFNTFDLELVLYKPLNGAFAGRIKDYAAPAIDPVPPHVRRSLRYLVSPQYTKTERPCAQLVNDLPYFLWDGRRTPCCILNDARHTAPEFSRPELLRRFQERAMPPECERCSFFSGYDQGGRS